MAEGPRRVFCNPQGLALTSTHAALNIITATSAPEREA